ncbi:MAG: hypothetical protein IT446_11175 [Phycisphaerales bacterium]|nr:hypothetical protein [Phycisphaerales bacterium]
MNKNPVQAVVVGAGVGAGLGLLLRHQVALPHIWQVVLQFFRRQSRKMGQHAAQLQLRVDLVPLGAGDQELEPLQIP